MKRILGNIMPEEVFGYFEDICGIPHISHHTGELRDYIENFAIRNRLEYVKDDNGNIVVYKNASIGYEEHEPVILQGHIDMVGAVREDIKHDFLKMPLKLYVDEDGGYVGAYGTTLGADDGIAAAYMLAILGDTTLRHPPIEAVFTTDEETGMTGAAAFDCTVLKGKRIINLDSEEEGIFLMGCAGGMRCDITVPLKKSVVHGTEVIITVEGLTGGHSGDRIGTGRPSANILMGRILEGMYRNNIFSVKYISGGVVDNAICTKCVSGVVCTCKPDAVTEYVKKTEKELKQEYYGIDDNITVSVEFGAEADYNAADESETRKLISLLRSVPQGVIMRNPDNSEMVETSLNLGILKVNEESAYMGYSLRSSHESAIEDLKNRLHTIAEYYGGNMEMYGKYPAWTPNPESLLGKLAGRQYTELTGKKPEYRVIHAGLECGLFYKKIPGADIISYGPDIYDIHTYNERLSIESARRVYVLTVRILEKL